MKLGTLKSQNKDGELVVVSKNNLTAAKVNHIAPNLQFALENWNTCYSSLNDIYLQLNEGKYPRPIKVNEADFHSPLPRAYQWLDGSAYIQHVILVRKARHAELPETLKTVPLMYQGSSDSFLSPQEDIPLISPSHGVDFEGEVGVITDFVPMGTKENEALKLIRLCVIINDVSLSGIIPEELKGGFGFLQGKPSSAFAPFAITPDELGVAWKDGRIHLPLRSELNGKWYGHPNAGEMFFSFGKLIEHACRTRSLCAGTIIGSGTVSNEDETVGSSCLAEKRMLEKIKTGEIQTPFLQVGDTIKFQMLSSNGENLFGTIFQKVAKSNVTE